MTPTTKTSKPAEYELAKVMLVPRTGGIQMTRFIYSRWRHGGWYVDNVRYPSGACGCVSRNFPDHKWRIVCDERDPQPTYPNRDAAALAELQLINKEQEVQQCPPRTHA